VDSLTGKPSRNLGVKNLVVNNRKKQTVTIDTRKYKIKIPGKEFFVAVEWMFTLKNKRQINPSIPLTTSEGRTLRTIAHSYQPFIGMIDSGSKESNVWVLTPEMEWKLYTHNMPYMTDLAMSAEVAY
jgi:hypothetical protein